MKVDEFIFPTNFIILDMEEDKKVPIILGRPFLDTGRALIDVDKGELRQRVQEEEVTFIVFNSIKYPHDNDSCFRVDIIEAIVSNQLGPLEPLETSLIHEDPSFCEYEVVATPKPGPTRLADLNRNPGTLGLFLFIFRVIKFSFSK